jgi:hypothetical protein
MMVNAGEMTVAPGFSAGKVALVDLARGHLSRVTAMIHPGRIDMRGFGNRLKLAILAEVRAPSSWGAAAMPRRPLAFTARRSGRRLRPDYGFIVLSHALKKR